MASTTGQTLDAIEQEILSSPKSFSYDRLVSNLYAVVKANGHDPAKKIRIRPALSLQINRSEILSVVKNEHDEYDVTTNFMGLYGTSSPLPSFYTEELMELEQEEQTTARRFLDVIHQRLFQLYSKARRKYDVLSQVVEYQTDDFPKLMHHLIGTSDKEIRNSFIDPDSLIRFSGFFANKQRSAAGLKQLLVNYLADLEIDVQVEQFVERQVTVPDQHLSSLGLRSCELGNTALVGNIITDNRAKIAIHFGPLTQETFDALVNDKPQWETVKQLIKIYINRPLEVDIKLKMVTQSAQGIQIGGSKWCQLGYDTWLLQSNELQSNDNQEDILVTTLRLD